MENYGLIRTKTSTAILKSIPIPKVRDDYILVETHAVALQPTDWTSLDAVGKPGVLNGCDYAGVILEVGSKVTRFKKGDRVTGFSHGANDADPETGAFARYILAKGDTQLHIPDTISYEEAVASASAILVTGLGLYYFLGLPWPNAQDKLSEELDTVLVYGASTSVGSIAMQFAKLSGCKVITLCSSKHFPMVRARGIENLYDHRLEDVGTQIRADTNGRITKVFDTVAVESSAGICAAAIGPKGGHYVNLLGIDCPRPDVKSEFFLAYGVSGEKYIFEGEEMPAEPGYYEFTVKLARIAETLWAEGAFQVHPYSVLEGGLNGVLEGMQRMRERKGPSGEKWVYRTSDTKWPAE